MPRRWPASSPSGRRWPRRASSGRWTRGWSRRWRARSTSRSTPSCRPCAARMRPRASRPSSPSASPSSRDAEASRSMDLGIAGKVALVTGGARSLGKADATVLAGEGCQVAIVDLNAEGAEEAAQELTTAGGVARGYACDIRDTAQVQETVQRIERDLGPVDICVNNAGMIYTVGQL